MKLIEAATESLNFYIEVKGPDCETASQFDEVVGKNPQTIEGCFDLVKTIGAAASNNLWDLAHETQIEFSIKLGALGQPIVAAEAETGTFRVRLTIKAQRLKS